MALITAMNTLSDVLHLSFNFHINELTYMYTHYRRWQYLVADLH